MDRRLGRLWLREAAVGGRWEEGESAARKRLAVETVEAYGLVHEAMELAREVREASSLADRS
jgi:enoyl-CoA hydratase/carnithine racemase